MALARKGGSEGGLDDESVDDEWEELDDKTHAEVRMLYQESTATIRFVKNHQWKTVGATLLAYLGLIFVAGYVGADADLKNILMAITILLTTSVIFTLIIYQFWMQNEINKINLMESRLSQLFRRIRAVKSKREGHLHRYTLLLFMTVVVVLGAVVVHYALAQIAST